MQAASLKMATNRDDDNTSLGSDHGEGTDGAGVPRQTGDPSRTSPATDAQEDRFPTPTTSEPDMSTMLGWASGAPITESRRQESQARFSLFARGYAPPPSGQEHSPPYRRPSNDTVKYRTPEQWTRMQLNLYPDTSTMTHDTLVTIVELAR